MNDPHEHETEPPTSGGYASASPLISALRYLRASSRTSGAGHGGGQSFPASFAALLEWGDAQGFLKQKSEFPFLALPPTAQGHEHQAWYDEKSNRWFKATYDNKFGLAWGREGTATPTEYLERLRLQNFYFGDDIRLEALVNCEGKLRVLTSQPNINGEPAPAELIKRWFETLSFQRIEAGGSVAWYHEAAELLIADAHEGNVIITKDSVLVPIDLNITEPNEDMKRGILPLLKGS